MFTCGQTIVANTISLTDKAGILARHLHRRTLIWDNLYCNDYRAGCFTGPWTGRVEAEPVLLNGTGLVKADKLLLQLMTGQDRQMLLTAAGVPEAFAAVESCFWHPVFSNQSVPIYQHDTDAMLAALEHLLWKWKGPPWPVNGTRICLA